MRHRQNDAFATHGIAPGDIPPAPPPPDSQLPHRATYGLTHRGLGWVQNYTTSFPTCSYTPASPTAHTTSLTSLVHVYTSCARCGHTPSATKCETRSQKEWSLRTLVASYLPPRTLSLGILLVHVVLLAVASSTLPSTYMHPIGIPTCHVVLLAVASSTLPSRSSRLARWASICANRPVCMHACTHACVHACMCACMHACMHVWVGGCMLASICAD